MSAMNIMIYIALILGAFAAGAYLAAGVIDIVLYFYRRRLKKLLATNQPAKRTTTTFCQCPTCQATRRKVKA